MAFKGDLTNISLFDVFQTLSQNRQNGVLVLTRDGQTKKIHISPEGVRIFFTRSFRPLRLGEIFVRRGRITPQDVEILLLEQKKQYRPMGELLVESGKVTQEEVASVLRYHAEDEIFEVFGWDRGTFSFYDGQDAGDPTTPLSDILMDPAGLCLEAARRLDEMEHLREAIPTTDEYYVQAEGAAPDAGEGGDAAAFVFDALAEPASIDDIRDLVGLSLHDTLAAIQSLLGSGRIRLLTVDELLASAEAAAERGELDRAAAILEKAHRHQPNDRAILERCVEVLGRLSQPRALAQYLAALGSLCLAEGEVEAAIEHLEESVRADSTQIPALAALRDAYARQNDVERLAEVSVRLARSQADRGDLQDAIETCRSGTEVAPHAVPLRFCHAQILVRAGQVDAAREEIHAVIRATGIGSAAKSDKAYELLSNCYRLLLKLDPSDGEAEAGLREVDRQRMLTIRRKKLVVRGGAAAAVLLILVGVGLVTGGPSAQALAAEIRKAQQKKNSQRVVDLANELVEAHPGSEEARWAATLRDEITSEASASDSARRNQEKALQEEMSALLDEARTALAEAGYIEALAPVKRFVAKLNRPEMAFLRKTMQPHIESSLDGFLERVRVHFENDRRQVAAGEVALNGLEGKAAELLALEEKLNAVRSTDWARLLPDLLSRLATIGESPNVGRAQQAIEAFRKRLAGAQAGFANLDPLFYAVRRERLRAEILDLHKSATTVGQEHLNACDFDRARVLYEAVCLKSDEVRDQEPREHFVELIGWLELRGIKKQSMGQIERIDHVNETLKFVDELRRQGKAGAAYRMMRDLVSDNRLVKFENRYKLPYEVVTVPVGADVEVNGKAVGKTPCEIEMEIGQKPVLVRLHRDGFRSAEARLVPTDPTLDGVLRIEMAKDLAWEREVMGGAVEAHPTIAGGMLLLATSDASLLALDLGSGDRLWEAPTGLLQRITARPVVAGKSAFMITLDGLLHEVRLADGKIVERLDLGAQVDQDPAVAGETVFVATRRPSLLAVRGSRILWERPLKESPSTPVVHLDGRVFVGTAKGAVLVHDAATGEPKDEYRIASGSSFWGGLAAHRHLVLAGAEDGKLYAFDTRSGRQAWAYATGGPIAAPALSDGTRVFLPARDGYIYVLSTEGTLVERLDMTYVVTARSAQANGFAYFLGNNRARAFETDGDEWWTMSFDAETPVHVVAGGDRVVVVTDKPWIYALPADAR